MKFSVCSSVEESSSSAHDENLVDWLRSSEARTKDKSALWSPCLFSDTTRKQNSAVEVTCLALDFDNGVKETVRKLLDKLKLHHVWHTSASHTAAKPKWRLIVFLDKPVPAKSWPGFWDRVVKALGLGQCDPACKNVGRFYFVPLKGTVVDERAGLPLPTEEFLNDTHEVQSHNEDLLKLRKQLLRAQNIDMLALIRLGLAGKELAPEGARDDTVNKLGYYIGKFVAPIETQPESVLAILHMSLPGSEPRSHWEEKFKKSYARGMQERLTRHEEKAKGIKDIPDLQTRTSITGEVAIISNTFNAHTILKREGTYRFRKNLVEDTVEMATADAEFQPFRDTDATLISNWLQKNYRLTISSAQVYEQAQALASENAFDPISDYLSRLEWDGVNRIDGFLTGYLGCADTPEARLYSRKWLVSLVARALRPGCKMDTVLVLQGAQGLGKSTALRLLTEPWFSDTKVVVGDKDSMLAASRFWVHEFAELASLKRADLETIKAFFTSVQDSFRPPYGRTTVTKPRRCVFIATTNESEFLTDPTGARRFWVVSVINQIDFNAIARDRDQLLAEAVDAFKKGETWWLESIEDKKLQEIATEPYQSFELSAKAETIRQWWDNQKVKPDRLTTARVVLEVWNVPVERATRSLEMEAGRCLRYLGFTKVRTGRTFAYRPSLTWKDVTDAFDSDESGKAEVV